MRPTRTLFFSFFHWLTTISLQAVKIDPYLNVDAGTLGPLEYVFGLVSQCVTTDKAPGTESASSSPMEASPTWILETTSAI